MNIVLKSHQKVKVTGDLILDKITPTGDGRLQAVFRLAGGPQQSASVTARDIESFTAARRPGVVW